jgi:hypothetical protein
MDMNGKKKFQIMALLLVVGLGIFLGQFWSCTLCAFGKTVAAGLFVLLIFLKFLAGMTGMHFWL